MSIIKFLIPVLIFFIFDSCRNSEDSPNQNFDLLSIYVSRDTTFDKGQTFSSIKVVDKKLLVPAEISLQNKIKILLDSMSSFYFHGLSIEIISIDSSINNQKILIINLKEKPNFRIPESLGSYQTWYDYFQGSTGGMNTETILKESILQREYNREWIDGLRILYQGDSIGVWDHINLDGLLLRN
ncbi:MAG TPA: hypothetical protein VI583_17825 [Cyclobacteriaceae bacterium]|nr:hypothetical protein [Cyclobacteriaceae bacterium]